MINFTDITEVRNILNEYDFNFSKSLGQNFLIEDKRRHGTEKIKAAYSKRNTTVCMRYLERSNLFHDNKCSQSV